MHKDDIVVVSGLPRSGTSLMMQILQAAGIPLLTDGQRPPDAHNPKGYYEFAPVKKLADDSSWLPGARGKAVKIISYLLPHLPADYHYLILFMNRDMREIIGSQNKMLLASGKPLGKLSDARLEERFAIHLREIHHWLARQTNVDFMDVDFNSLITQPQATLNMVWQFLSLQSAMDGVLNVVDPNLYRTRRSADHLSGE